MARLIPSLCIAAALVFASTATAASEAEGMNRASTVVIGSSFVRTFRDSGSYGTGASTVTVTRMPNREWKGRAVAVWQPSAGPTLLMDPHDGAFVALVTGDQPAVTFEPASGWQWPLQAGKSWTRTVMMTLHPSNETIPVETKIQVEAYEDVSIPAGTFKAWRVRSVDNIGNEDVNWFSTDLTVFVKQKLTRTAQHRMGPGVRETELVSHAIRHQ